MNHAQEWKETTEAGAVQLQERVVEQGTITTAKAAGKGIWRRILDDGINSRGCTTHSVIKVLASRVPYRLPPRHAAAHAAVAAVAAVCRHMFSAKSSMIAPIGSRTTLSATRIIDIACTGMQVVTSGHLRGPPRPSQVLAKNCTRLATYLSTYSSPF